MLFNAFFFFLMTTLFLGNHLDRTGCLATQGPWMEYHFYVVCYWVRGGLCLAEKLENLPANLLWG